MRLSTPFAKIWPALLAGGLALGALALIWYVRDTPLALGVFTRIDALSAFFLFALFGGVALALAARPTSPSSCTSAARPCASSATGWSRTPAVPAWRGAAVA